MGIEVIACPTCGAEVRFGVPLGGSVLGVTETPPDDGRRSEDDGPDAEESSEEGTEVEKRRTAACPEGHEFGVRFAV